jgi:hypothetical protein
MVMTTEKDIRLAVTDGQREYLQSKLDQYTRDLSRFQRQAKYHVLSGIIMPFSLLGFGPPVGVVLSASRSSSLGVGPPVVVVSVFH